jgi:hypothetical protein
MVRLCYRISLSLQVSRIVLDYVIGEQMTFGVNMSLNVHIPFMIVLDRGTKTFQVKIVHLFIVRLSKIRTVVF